MHLSRTRTHSFESKQPGETRKYLINKTLKFLLGIPWEYCKNKQKTICKNFAETDSSIHERIQKSRAPGVNKQLSSSSICKYNLLQKSGTLLGSLYRPEKVGSARTEMQKIYTTQKKSKCTQ